MAEPTSPPLYQDEYSIEKRADGTEDFHCIIASCAGVFSYRTLRALNNHRTSSHSLPDIPKRKRGPKGSESSRTRCRSADTIKRQVMKRAIDISKREQGCRSMARLRASRLAMAQAGCSVSNNNHVTSVIQKVDKLLESWEGDSSKRRSLLERRIQMARLEWAMKGETSLLPTSEGRKREANAQNDRLCFDDGETSEKRELPRKLLADSLEEAEESSAMDYPQQEMIISEQIEPNAADFAGLVGVHTTEMDEIKGIFCDMEAHRNGEKGCVKNVSCSGIYEAKHVWQNYSIRKFVSVNQFEIRLLNERVSAQQADKIIPCIDSEKVCIEYDDPRLF